MAVDSGSLCIGALVEGTECRWSADSGDRTRFRPPAASRQRGAPLAFSVTADRLEGNAGNDALRGGFGADLFVPTGGGGDGAFDFNGGDRTVAV